MNAVQLISHDIVPLTTSMSGAEALELMSDYYVQHLPIVNNKQFLGLISEEDILEHDIEEAVGSYQLSLQKPSINAEDHVFDVMAQVARMGLSAIPVVDEDGNYMGVISQQSLLTFFAQSFSFAERGSILILEMNKPDYALSEISRVIESENVAIISSFITSDPNTNRILVHLKINKPEVHRVRAALERYEYNVKAMYTESEDREVLKDRFESFMHYLNV